MDRDSTSSTGIVLRTEDGRYLCYTGSDWGPSYQPGLLAEAEVFYDSEWAVRNAMTAWGGHLEQVPVTVTRTVKIGTTP